MRLVKLLLLLVSLLGACRAPAPPPPLPGHLHLTGGRDRQVIPFQMVNNLMVVPMQINGSDTLHFVVDTGVRTALLTNLRYRDSLELAYTRETMLSGLGQGDDLPVLHSYGNAFTLFRLQGYHQDLFVLMEDIFRLSEKLGIPVHGLVGHDLFKNFVVRADYAQQRLVLHDPATFRLRGGRWQSVPLDLRGGKPYVRCTLRQGDDTLAVKLLVDTGASFALSLDLPSHPALRLPDRTVPAYLGRGLRGDVRGDLGRVAALEIGGFTLRNLPAAFPDSASLRDVVGHHGRHGSVGADLLRRFDLVFDYPGRRLYLRPNAKTREPFRTDLSGLELYCPLPGLPVYVVSTVTPGTPAAAAGVLPQDQITRVDNTSVAEYSLGELVELLRSRPGRRVYLEVVREGKTLNFQFELSERI